MAAAQATHRQAEELLIGLLGRFESEERRKPLFAWMLQQCMDRMHRIDPMLRDRIEASWRFGRGWAKDSWIIVLDPGSEIEHLATANSLREWLNGNASPRIGSVTTVNNFDPSGNTWGVGVYGDFPLADLLGALFEWRTSRGDLVTLLIREVDGPNLVLISSSGEPLELY